MNMEIQSIESINTLAKGLIRRSPQIRLVTLFRKTRPVDGISFIGDYPLIAHLISLIIEQTGRTVNRWGILKTINESVELSVFGKREKTETVDELLRMQELSTQMK